MENKKTLHKPDLDPSLPLPHLICYLYLLSSRLPEENPILHIILKLTPYLSVFTILCVPQRKGNWVLFFNEVIMKNKFY